MKKTSLLAMTLLFGAATLVVAKVNTDFDKGVDWSHFHTYSWIKVQAEDPLWNDRISQAIGAQLMEKGWRMVPSGGEASISAFGATKTEQSYQTWYDGFGGGWGWRRGWGLGETATTTVQNTPVGTLNVDIFDTSSKKLIWRGSSSETLSDKPEKNEEKLRKDVAEMFKNFPARPRG